MAAPFCAALRPSTRRGLGAALRRSVAGAAAAHPLQVDASAELLPYEAIPGPASLPVLGTFLDYYRGDGVARPWLVMDRYYKEHGAIVKQNLVGEEEVIVYDPKEYLKVFQAEGTMPKGVVADLWPFKKYLELRFEEPPGLVSNGEPWQKARRKLQKHMFAPKVAASYSTFLNAASQNCSAHLWTLDGGLLRDPNSYLENCVFELFTAFAFGEAKPVLRADADPRDLQFVRDSQESLALGVQLCFNPMAQHFPNKKWDQFVAAYDRAYKRCKDYVLEYVAARSAGEFNYAEGEGPYLERCLAAAEYTQRELEIDMANVLMAAVDTTVHVVKWLVLHLATCPEAQEKLAEELRTELAGRDVERADMARLPYLQAAVREAHRLTPPSWQLTSRRLDADIALGGYRIPAGKKITMNIRAVQLDPAVAGDDPHLFRPERFLPDAVAARKDDQLASVLDHRLLTTPFSFGARMCMGARIAEMELASLVARLVQDWRFAPEPLHQPWEMSWGTMLKAEPFPTLRFMPR